MKTLFSNFARHFSLGFSVAQRAPLLQRMCTFSVGKLILHSLSFLYASLLLGYSLSNSCVATPINAYPKRAVSAVHFKKKSSDIFSSFSVTFLLWCNFIASHTIRFRVFLSFFFIRWLTTSIHKLSNTLTFFALESSKIEEKNFHWTFSQNYFLFVFQQNFQIF